MFVHRDWIVYLRLYSMLHKIFFKLISIFMPYNELVINMLTMYLFFG